MPLENSTHRIHSNTTRPRAMAQSVSRSEVTACGVSAIMVPAAVGYLVLGRPIVALETQAARLVEEGAGPDAKSDAGAAVPLYRRFRVKGIELGLGGHAKLSAVLQHVAAARCAPAHQRAHAGEQLLALERLDEVVVGAGLQPAHAVVDLVAVFVGRRLVPHVVGELDPEPGLGEEVGMQHIEWFALVFGNQQLEPGDQGIVCAFVCPKAGDVDAARDERPLFGRRQVRRGAEDADGMSG